MKHSPISQAINEVVDLKIRAVNEYIKETVEPLLKDIEALNKKIFERAYKEVRELEEG